MKNRWIEKLEIELKKMEADKLSKIMYVIGYTKYNLEVNKDEVIELIQKIYRGDD